VAERSAVGNAGDAEQVGRARRSQKFQRDVELDDLRAVLSIPAGRRLVWRIMDRYGLFRSVFSAEALVMARNSGWQDVAHWLMHEIEVAKPDAFLTMMQEHAPKPDPETTKEREV
jgi:hypothetical protein